MLTLAVLGLLVWGLTAVAGRIAGVAAGAAPDPDQAPTEHARPGPCSVGGLEIALDAPTRARAGERVPFTVTVTNAGERACLVDAGRASLAVTVVSGEDRVWSSGDCPGSPAERRLLLAPGDRSQTEILWSGTRSTEACAGSPGQATAGTYRAGASLDGHTLDGQDVVFRLE